MLAEGLTPEQIQKNKNLYLSSVDDDKQALKKRRAIIQASLQNFEARTVQDHQWLEYEGQEGLLLKSYYYNFSNLSQIDYLPTTIRIVKTSGGSSLWRLDDFHSGLLKDYPNRYILALTKAVLNFILELESLVILGYRYQARLGDEVNFQQAIVNILNSDYLNVVWVSPDNYLLLSKKLDLTSKRKAIVDFLELYFQDLTITDKFQGILLDDELKTELKDLKLAKYMKNDVFQRFQRSRYLKFIQQTDNDNLKNWLQWQNKKIDYLTLGSLYHNSDDASRVFILAGFNYKKFDLVTEAKSELEFFYYPVHLNPELDIIRRLRPIEHQNLSLLLTNDNPVWRIKYDKFPILWLQTNKLIVIYGYVLIIHSNWEITITLKTNIGNLNWEQNLNQLYELPSLKLQPLTTVEIGEYVLWSSDDRYELVQVKAETKAGNILIALPHTDLEVPFLDLYQIID